GKAPRRRLHAVGEQALLMLNECAASARRQPTSRPRRSPGKADREFFAPQPLPMWPHVARLANMETGIRELKDNLSRYIRRVEAGQRISVTAHGRVVAELVPPGTATRKSPGSRWDELIAAGILHPPVETGDPFEDWPDIRLPPGTAAELIDADRGEA